MKRALTFGPAIVIALAGILFATSNPVFAATATLGQVCGTNPPNTGGTPEEIQSVVAQAGTLGLQADAYTCQNTSQLSASDKQSKCVSGLCAGGANVLCCVPGIGTAPTVGGGESDAPAGPGTVGQEGGVGRLALPACVSDGKCGLDDIVRMGVNFANFLFGISGAIFLLVFVISGFRYIFFAWDAGAVKSAKDSLIKASIGMAIIALAGIATTFVYNNLRGGTDSGTESRGATCEEEVTGEPTGYTCQPITGIPSKDANYGDYTAALNSLGCRPSSRETTNLCTGRTYCCRPGVSPVYPAQE